MRLDQLLKYLATITPYFYGEIQAAYKVVKSLDILCIALNTASAFNRDLISMCYEIKTARDTKPRIKHSFWKRLKYLFTGKLIEEYVMHTKKGVNIIGNQTIFFNNIEINIHDIISIIINEDRIIDICIKTIEGPKWIKEEF